MKYVKFIAIRTGLWSQVIRVRDWFRGTYWMISMSGLFHDSLHRNSSRGLLTDTVWQVECCICQGLITPILMALSICYVFLCFRQTVDSKLQTSMFTGMCSQHDYKGTGCHCNQLISFCLFWHGWQRLWVLTLRWTLNIRGNFTRGQHNSKVWLFRKWPASWSSGQSFWLLITRSRVRFPALPWEFSL